MSEEAIFVEALAIQDRDSRRAFLDRVCTGDLNLRAEVESLLAAHADAGLFDRRIDSSVTVAQPPDFVPSSHTPPQSGDLVSGRYRLGERLGEGGMGTVYQAMQEQPMRRLVAIKVIRCGMGTAKVLARFDAERQALAILDHPSIAKIFDAGTMPDGSPFFVMELVDGRPLNRYCDEQRLTIEQRLKLFLQISQAVQHAHQKGIMHRDLKPGNILVVEQNHQAVPKVIDFGLAKALMVDVLPDVSLDEHRTMIGTPLYMAPEQTGISDIDMRADVYSLGVILYELLTGSTPIEQDSIRRAEYAEMLRVIREVEPPTPVTRLSHDEALPNLAAVRQIEPARLKNLVRGDLEWVTMKCLEKDRNRRYDTVNAIILEIQRFLAHEPVMAGPPGRGYRLRKFVRRNRSTVIAASLIAASLVIGIVVAIAGLVKADRERGKAETANQLTQKRLVQIEKSNGTLLEIFNDLNFRKPDTNAKPLEAVLADRLAKAGLELDRESLGDPLQMARLQHQLGISVMNLGRSKDALALFDRALKIRTDQLGPKDRETLAVLGSMAEAEAEAGNVSKAAKLAEEVFRLRKENLGEDDVDTVTAMNNLGNCMRLNGEPRKALALLEIVVAKRRATLPKSDLNLFIAESNRSGCLMELRDFKTAISELESLVPRMIAAYGADHNETLIARNDLATCYVETKQLLKAVPLLEELLATRRRLRGADHPETLVSLNNLAGAFLSAKQLDKALPLLQEALNVSRVKRGVDHPKTLAAQNNLGSLYWQAKQFDKSIPLFEELLRFRRIKPGPGHPDTWLAQANLGNNYKSNKQYDKAIPLLKETHEASRSEPNLTWTSKHLLEAYLKAGMQAESLAMTKELLERARIANPPESAKLATALDDFGYDLFSVKAWEDSALILKESLAIREKLHPDSWQRFGVQSDYARALVEFKKGAEAEPLLLAAYAGLSKHRASVKTPLNRLNETIELNRLNETIELNRLNETIELNRLNETIDLIIRVYQAQGNADKVEEWKAEKAKLEMK